MRRRESPVVTNYCVKNLRKQALQQFSGVLSFKTKRKRKCPEQQQTEMK